MATVGERLADLEQALHIAYASKNPALIEVATVALRDEYAKHPALKNARVLVPYPQYDLPR